MDAKKCDRCGKYYELSTWGINHDKVQSYRSDNPKNGKDVYDLCPECMDEFRRFMDAKVMGDARNIST